MERDQESLQFLGVYGIIKESLKLIFKWWLLFAQITLTLILPLAFIFLAHFLISQLLFFKIFYHENSLGFTQAGTPGYRKLSNLISSELTEFFLFKLAYFTFLMILSLLSTSAVVYTIACVYTGKEISFKKVMTVVPRAWKRVIVTFLWYFAIAFVYNVTLLFLFFFGMDFIGVPAVRIVITVVSTIVYTTGLVYITLVWQLAGVVSVLEDLYGIRAMGKSRRLIKGKLGTCLALFLLLVVCFVGNEGVFEIFVVFEVEPRLGLRILIHVACLVVMVKVFLFGLVVQTLVYFVCKSYHHDYIDKSSLSDHLDVFLGDYVPLKSKDVQLEQIRV